MGELSSRALFKTSLQHLREGLTADCQQRSKDAAMAYMEGAPLLLQLAREEGVSTPIKQLLKTKSQLYLNRIQLIKAKLDAGEAVPPNTSADRAHPNLDGVQEDSREFLKTLSYQPFKCSLDDVKGIEHVKEFLWKNVVLPLTFPGFPDNVTRVKKGMLLYGLPGIGKTMLMCAIAEAVSCPVFRLTATDLVSRWMGSEKCLEQMRDVFKCARQNQPCVLCIDDFEMLFSVPGKNAEDGLGVKLREELFSQLKEVNAENQVTVIAASQQPWLISGTLRRRFDRRFYLPLPSEEERAQILSHTFTSIKHNLSQTDFDLLGQMTLNFTGADLTGVSRSCSMSFVRTLQKATHFRKVTTGVDESKDSGEREMLVPCEPHASGAIEITVEFLNLDRLLELPVTRMIVEEEVKQTRASVGDAELERMNQWHEDIGQGD